jgi:hypothetical protein
MRSAFVFLAVLVHPLVAAAQPDIAPSPGASSASRDPTWIVGGGIGGPGIVPSQCYSPDGDCYLPNVILGIVYGEVEYRLAPRVPVYVRASYVTGTIAYDTSWWTARLGGEYRPCTSGKALCAIVGADLGVLQSTNLCQDGPMRSCEVEAASRTGFAVNGRLGIDTGWQHVRVRVAVDSTRALPVSRFTLDQYGTSRDLGRYLTLEFGVAAAF